MSPLGIKLLNIGFAQMTTLIHLVFFGIAGIVYFNTNSVHPAHYKEKLEHDVAETMLRFIQPPSKEAYNLTSGTNPTMHLSQRGHLKILEMLLNGKNNGFFIEYGAADGEFLSNTLYFELRYNWTGLLLEANTDLYKKLLTKKRKAFASNTCLCERKYAPDVDMVNTLDCTGAKKTDSKGLLGMELITAWNILNDASRRQCATLFSLILAVGNPTIDLISFDAKVAGLEILQTLPWHRLNVRALLVESVYNRVAINNYLDGKGFYNVMEKDNIYIKREESFEDS